jgi:hypothetical protein
LIGSPEGGQLLRRNRCLRDRNRRLGRRLRLGLRLAGGEALSGYVKSEEIADLDALPFPRWDLVGMEPTRRRGEAFTRPLGSFSLLASRSCPDLAKSTVNC